MTDGIQRALDCAVRDGETYHVALGVADYKRLTILADKEQRNPLSSNRKQIVLHRVRLMDLLWILKRCDGVGKKSL